MSLLITMGSDPMTLVITMGSDPMTLQFFSIHSHCEYTSTMFVFMKSAPTSAENGDAMGGVSVRQIHLWIRHQLVDGAIQIVGLKCKHGNAAIVTFCSLGQAIEI